MSIRQRLLTLIRRILGTQQVADKLQGVSENLDKLSLNFAERSVATVNVLHAGMGQILSRLEHSSTSLPAREPSNGHAVPASDSREVHGSAPARDKHPIASPVRANGRPTLSVLMTNYNHGRYLETSLGAILAQSCRPIEVVVVDDASTDDSVAILESFAKREPIVKLLRNEKNRGVLASWHEGYRHLTGDYVYSASADDCVLPGLFEKSMTLLGAYPGAALCCSYPASFQENDDGTLTWNENPVFWSEVPRYFSPMELADALCGDYIPGHTAIMRRVALDEVGGLRPELKWHCDWFAMLAMAFRHGVCFVPEALAGLRISRASYSGAGTRRWEEQEQVLLEILRLLKSPEFRDLLACFARGSALSHFNEGHQFARAYLANPDQWDATALTLLAQPLAQWSRWQDGVHSERGRKRSEANASGRIRPLCSALGT